MTFCRNAPMDGVPGGTVRQKLGIRQMTIADIFPVVFWIAAGALCIRAIRNWDGWGY